MPDLFVIFIASFNGVISLGAIVANTIIITAFAKTKSIQNVTNMFLIQLSFTDLMKATLILPIKVYNLFADVKTFDNSYCQVSGIIVTMTTILAVLYLAAIAVVRYFKIIKWDTFDQVFSLKKGILYSFLIVIAVFALAVLPVLGVGQYTYSTFHGACFTNWAPHNILFRSLFYIYNIGISYPVVIYCYWRIFGFLRSHGRRIFPRRGSNAEGTITEMTTKASTAKSEDAEKGMVGAIDSPHVRTAEELINVERGKQVNMPTDVNEAGKLDAQGGKEREEERGVVEQKGKDYGRMEQGALAGGTVSAMKEGKVEVERQARMVIINQKTNSRATRSKMKVTRQDIKVTRVLFIGVLTYAICWFPATITTILFLSNAIKPSAVHLHIIVTLVEAKLLLNPFIYGYMNTQFRQAIKNLLCRRS